MQIKIIMMKIELEILVIMKVSANEIKTYAMSRNQTTKANQL